MTRGGELSSYLAGRAARDRHDVAFGGAGKKIRSDEPGPICDRLTIRREERAPPLFGHQARLSAQRRNHVDAASILLGAEHDASAVGGECRLVLVGVVA